MQKNNKISCKKGLTILMGITADEREIKLSFDGEKIVIEKSVQTEN